MVKIQERIVAYGHGKFTSGQPTYFCVHSTDNLRAGAANHVAYWSREPTYAMHLVVDQKEAFHAVPYDRVCAQVGNGNPYCEGVEVCEDVTTHDEFMQTIRNAASVAAQRLTAHKWGIDRLISHDQARIWWGGTTHTDPLPYFERWHYTWDEFKQLVQNYMKGTDDDMVTEQDKKDIARMAAENVVNYRLNNVLLRDRIIGTDQAANGANNKAAQLVKELLRTDDVVGDGRKNGLYLRLSWIDRRVRESEPRIKAVETKVDALEKKLDTIIKLLEKKG